MVLLNYFLAFIFSLFGLFIGILLGYITKEELKPEKKYLIWMQNFILIIAAVLALYSFQLHIILFVSIGLIITVALIYFSPKAIIGYLILISLVILIFEKTNLFILTASLIFLYGFPSGSLILAKK